MSTATHEVDKSALLSSAIELARSGRGSGGPPRDTVDALIRGYYRHVAVEDIAARSDVDVYGAFVSHYRLAGNRPQGTARVRILTPGPRDQGWSAGGHSVVEVVVDDMPFLVDSLTMELSRQLHDVHLVIHPVFDVVRDITGSLQDVRPVDNGAEPADGVVRESWMHVEIDRVPEGVDLAAIEEAVQRVLRDVRESVEDWEKMHTQVAAIVHELTTEPPEGVDPAEVGQARDLLQWLADDHFTFLGYREYRLERQGDDEYLRGVPGSGLGILRADQDMAGSSGKLPAAAAAKAREKTVLVLTKANSRSTVHRPAYLDYVGVKKFEDGEVVGERRFLGLYSSAAYTESLTRIPLLRDRASAVLRRIGFSPMGHDGKALMDTLETYPRDELFHTSVDELAPMAEQAMHARERRQLRLFIRRDTYGRYVSVLVYLPRDRYNTAVRERFSEILRERLGGDSVEFTVRLTESTTARVHFVVHPPKGDDIREVDASDLERRMIEASRSWRDDFTTAVLTTYGEDAGTTLLRSYLDSFPAAYREDFPARVAAFDLGRLEDIRTGEDGSGLDLSLYEDLDAGRGEARLKVYRVGPPLSLSQVLPMLSSMGVEVIDERPYELDLEHPTYIYEFGLRYDTSLPDEARELFQDAIRAVWGGFNEIDGFNALVLAAGLTWRQATLLRAYAKYLRQGNSPFALDSIEGALRGNVDITRLLVRLFEARFDPALDRTEAERSEAAVGDRIAKALDDVASLDHDRILRSYLTHIRATLRTNYFQQADAGGPKPYISLKLEPNAIPELPAPRPRYEVFVYSPRVEGSHLRFGAVARGGLRWSDRRDDFRTEVLGLVKAQMVKNTVIVPVGAKGAFFCKQLPPQNSTQLSDRDAWQAEGVACYTTFISGLLDITDNLANGETVPPRDVVRHDADDTYLVVAADKGTATFSDIANGIAKDYGFWLGDAFASGGSVGYDHKAMGITARGAWVSVRRHFRERGIDTQAEDFTVVGIGDMSGDVFGNGMLCSEHIRLVAAFDHRDIFVDPTPDAATSYAERKRLFDLPRSSWQDYDESLISEGGGVFSRQLKRIPLGDAVRRALGIDDGIAEMTPAELMSAILKAPVDLLWNGGIGTYVKGSDESHAAAGDKANDGIRVDGRDVRARAIGEGGNLGLTQLGRIEYAQSGGAGSAGSSGGGRLNTDFIDNSAGVDTSDHEVNLKILLDRVVKDGDLTEKRRNHLLAEMTDEVAELVLRDNYEQNLALANALNHAASMLHVHEEWIRRLEHDGVLDRELEGLPSSREVKRRAENGEGLTAPELSVLLAWTKIVLAQQLLDSDLPDDPYLDYDLRSYFPAQVREGFEEQVRQHPLRREIIVTQVVNDLVNGAGITYWPRLAGETGASAAELTRANFVAREIFGSLDLRTELTTFDNRLDATVQTRMRLEMRTLVERASRWLVNNRRTAPDSEGTVEQFRGPVQHTIKELPDLMSGRELAAYVERKEALESSGVPEELASRVAVLPPAYMLLGIMEIADREGLEPSTVARLHFALGERLGLPALVQRILALPRGDRWQTMARASLRDDLHGLHAQLTAQVLGRTPPEETAAARIAAWEDAEAVVVGRATATLEEICADERADLARLSVGLRVVRGLLTAG